MARAAADGGKPAGVGGSPQRRSVRPEPVTSSDAGGPFSNPPGFAAGRPAAAHTHSPPPFGLRPARSARFVRFLIFSRFFIFSLDNQGNLCIINMRLRDKSETQESIAGLCKGSTPDSDSVCEGSNPSSAAIKETSFVYQDKRGFLCNRIEQIIFICYNL